MTSDQFSMKQNCGEVSEVGMADRADIPGIETIKIKRQIFIPATRCLVCGKWEYPEFNNELYDPVIMGETSGICESCRKAIEWAKERMEGW